MPKLEEISSRIDDLVTKYMGILEIHGARPTIKLRSNLGSKWLGRTSWTSRQPDTTTVELQTSILADDRTLERVVAHEMVHHRDSISISPTEMALLKVGIRPDSHGANFREGAARINAIMGPGFVTKESDKEYKHSAPAKDFLVLITPLPRGKLGWQWAARLGPKAKVSVDEHVAKGSRLARSTDVRWTRGAKIERYGGYSMPRDDEEAAELVRLFESAPGPG